MHAEDTGNIEKGNKSCTGCGLVKPTSEYPKDRSKSDGLSTRCKPCKYAKTAEWRNADPDRAKQAAAKSYSKHRESRKAYGRKKYQDGGLEKRTQWREKNRDRDRETCRRWAKNHPDKTKMYARRGYENNREKRIRQATEWNKLHPKQVIKQAIIQNARRRSRKLANGGDGYTSAHWHEVLRRSGGMCAYCRTSEAKSVDHFIPLKLGGAHDYRNIVPACRRCNSTKRDNEPVKWITETLGPAALEYVRSIMLNEQSAIATRRAA